MNQTSQEPTVTEVLEELVSAAAIQNAELEALKAQIAAQTDKLAEVKRHGEAVRKSVNWDKLGENVFKGVSGAVLHKIEDVTQSSRKLAVHSESIRTTMQVQKETSLRLQNAANAMTKGAEDVDRATQRVLRASEGVAEARKRDWAHSAILCLVTACMAFFGAYWWSSAQHTEMSYQDMGNRLASSSYADDYCGYAGGQVLEYGEGGLYCGIIMQQATGE